MRNLILCLALGAAASSAFALTNEDLAANTWMPLEEQTESSCELPAMMISIRTVRSLPNPAATLCPAVTRSVRTERLNSPKWQ